MRQEIKNIVNGSEKLNKEQIKQLSGYIQNLRKIFDEKGLSKKKGKFSDCLVELFKQKEQLTDQEKETLDLALEAREQIILYNQKLVYFFAHRHKNRMGGVELNELFSIGFEYLIRAIENYNPDLNYEFSTLAYFWISNGINKECNKLENSLSVASSHPNKLYKIKKACSKLKSNGETLTVEKISQNTNLTEKSIRETLQSNYFVFNIDENEKPWDMIKDSASDKDEMTSLIEQTEVEKLYKELEKIDPIAKNILIDFYIYGLNKKRLKHKYNLSYTQINQKIKDYISILKERFDNYSARY